MERPKEMVSGSKEISLGDLLLNVVTGAEVHAHSDDPVPCAVLSDDYVFRGTHVFFVLDPRDRFGLRDCVKITVPV